MPPVWVAWFHDGVVVSSSSTPLPVWTPWPVRVPPIGFGPVISTELGSGVRRGSHGRSAPGDGARRARTSVTTARGEVHPVQVARGRGGPGQGDPALAGHLLDAEDVAGGGVDVVVRRGERARRCRRSWPPGPARPARRRRVAARRARAAPGRCRPAACSAIACACVGRDGRAWSTRSAPGRPGRGRRSPGRRARRRRAEASSTGTSPTAWVALVVTMPGTVTLSGSPSRSTDGVDTEQVRAVVVHERRRRCPATTRR